MKTDGGPGVVTARFDGDACLLRQFAPQAIEQPFSRSNVAAGQGQAAPGDVNENDVSA